MLVSLTLHNSSLPTSYWIFGVRKPENANSTLLRIAGMDKITGANWYSSCLGIFESFSILQYSFYLSSTAALANEYINSPFFFGWLSEKDEYYFEQVFWAGKILNEFVFCISKNQNNFVLYCVTVDRFPFDISRWQLLFSL